MACKLLCALAMVVSIARLSVAVCLFGILAHAAFFPTYSFGASRNVLVPLGAKGLVCLVKPSGINELRERPQLRKLTFAATTRQLKLGEKRPHLTQRSKNVLNTLIHSLQKCRRGIAPFKLSVANPSPIPTETGITGSTPVPSISPGTSGTSVPIHNLTPTTAPFRAQRIQKILSFWWGQNSPINVSDASERGKLIDAMYAHYSVSPTGPSNGGHFELYRQYRHEVLLRNPEAALGVYVSGPTTTNPVNQSDYDYPPSNYWDHDNDSSTAPALRCATPGQTYYSQYVASRRPDSHAFIDLNGSGLFQPILRSDRPESAWAPWNTAAFGWWPFEYFSDMGWILPQTLLYCRPVLDFTNPDAVSFVANTLTSLVGRAGEFEGTTAATLDNISIYRNEYNFWPGKGEPHSPYFNRAPDLDFREYLLSLKSALNEQGKYLVINTGTQGTVLAGAADIAFFEDCCTQRSQSSAETIQQLNAFQTFISAGTHVVQDLLDGFNAYSNAASMRFFLGVSMMVYQPGLYSFVPGLFTAGSSGYSEANALRYRGEFFNVPTCLGNALSTFHALPQSATVLIRRFENGAVILNTDDQPFDIGNISSLFPGLILPGILDGKDAIIAIDDCSCMAQLDSDFEAQCRTLYQRSHNPFAAGCGPSMPGDINCDGCVNVFDIDPFRLARTDPTAYRIRYPNCSLARADINGDNIIDSADEEALVALILGI